MTDQAPEQQVVNYLETSGYRPETIIRYLETQVEKEWAQADFAECGPGEKMTFGVCRKVGEAPAEPKPEQPGAAQPAGQKQEQKEQPKSAMEEKLEKAAKSQGSDPTNNKKVMIDGKAYGWAIRGGKPIMVEWGSVAGVKKVGPKQPAKKGGKRLSKAQKSAIEAQIKGKEDALAKQSNDAGRQAVQRQIDELRAQLGG